MVRSFMEIFLGEVSGHDVHCVATIAEARKTVTDSLPDVLVVDFLLPDGNGLDLGLETLRDEPHLCVVLVTGLELTEVCRTVARDREIPVLRKPFELEELLVLVGKGLSQK